MRFRQELDQGETIKIHWHAAIGAGCPEGKSLICRGAPDHHGVTAFDTTERGAILELIAALLEAAIDAFEQSEDD